jgi:hypothetical protein
MLLFRFFYVKQINNVYLCTIKKENMQNQHSDIVAILPSIIKNNGSTNYGTVRNSDFLAVINKGLYLCSAFDTQMHELEY